jgi:PAS domain-containing protein
MHEDVHEHQAGAARQRANLEFRRLLDKLPVAAYTTDAEGLITYFNQRAAETWGREPRLNDPADRH